MSLLLRFFYSVVFYACMITLTLICILGFPLFYLASKYIKKLENEEAIRASIWIYGWLWTRMLRLFTPVIVEGDWSAMPWPCIITPNHQSFFDAYCMGFLPIQNVVFVSSWPFRIPWYGPYMRKAKYINADEVNGEKFVQAGTERVEEGISIVVFPEGTRSLDKKTGRFRAGAFRIAMANNVPVLPMCIDGTGDFLAKGSFLLKRSPIRITLMDPVFPQDFAEFGDLGHSQLRREVKKRIQKELDRHRESA